MFANLKRKQSHQAFSGVLGSKNRLFLVLVKNTSRRSTFLARCVARGERLRPPGGLNVYHVHLHRANAFRLAVAYHVHKVESKDDRTCYVTCVSNVCARLGSLLL